MKGQQQTLSTTSEFDLNTFVDKLCQIQDCFFPARLKKKKKEKKN